MSKLAFSNKGRYTDFDKGYTLYSNRSRKNVPVEKKVYARVVSDYCRYLSERLEHDGMIDLPNRIGTLFTSLFFRKPQYRGSKFIGYGKPDWKSGNYDGSNTAFGVVFLPNRNRTANLRCYGFVTNRRLFKRLKQAYVSGNCNWIPMMFNEKMI